MVFAFTPQRGYFNPRLHEGGDINPASFPPPALNFNPRLHEGGDLLFLLSGWDVCYFNPRLHEGGDVNVVIKDALKDISIHASMKEATATYCDTSAIMYISSLNNFFVRYF